MDRPPSASRPALGRTDTDFDTCPLIHQEGRTITDTRTDLTPEQLSVLKSEAGRWLSAQRTLVDTRCEVCGIELKGVPKKTRTCGPTCRMRRHRQKGHQAT